LPERDTSGRAIASLVFYLSQWRGAGVSRYSDPRDAAKSTKPVANGFALRGALPQSCDK